MKRSDKSPALCLPLLGCALVAASLGCLTVRSDPPKALANVDFKAVPDLQWNAVFDLTHGWSGGDVAGSVDLGHGRALWLFGDTWIGEVAGGAHTPGLRMVNNSVGLFGGDSRQIGDPPVPFAMTFHWGHDDALGHPTAWLVPDRLRAQGNSKTSDPGHSHGWYWPTGGAAVVIGPGAKPCLVVFLFHLGKTEGRTGIWAFKSLGGAMAMIDNFDQPVEKWHVEQHEIPFAIGTDIAKTDAGLRETSWGVAAHWQPAETKDAAGVLYVYGIRNQSPLNRQLLLTRVPADALHERGKWQFYAGNGKWSGRLQDAAAIAEGLANELSVEEYSLEGRSQLVMVHSEPALGRRGFVRTASRPEGPWSKAIPVYSVPDVDRNPTYFAYAAKGHLQFSRHGELLISYVVNSQEFQAMFKDATIYRPRFISIPLPKHAGPS